MPPLALGAALEAERAWLTGYVVRHGAAPQDADDLVQEVFYRTWRANRLTEESRLRGYLAQAAKRLLIQGKREARGGVWQLTHPDGSELLVADPGAERPFSEVRARLTLAQGLARLSTRRCFVSERRQRCASLALLTDLDHLQIAARTGVAPLTVRTVVFRARKQLQGVLAETLK